jgi:O-methyltransferase
MRRGPGTRYRKLLTLWYLATRDRGAAARFLAAPGELGLRLSLLRRFVAVTNAVRGYHTQAEMLIVADAILRRGRLTTPLVVECGIAYGAATAKLGLTAAAVGGRLVAFDSFRGIPANNEVHRHLDGRRVVFRQGAFRGRESSVRAALEQFRVPRVELRRGLFADTLPAATLDQVAVALLDVDLLASTRTCVAHLVPRLAPGGVLFTQDGHLEATVALLSDPSFWHDEVGVRPPAIAGLGRRKLLAIPAPG